GEDAGLRELSGEVQRRLAAHRRQERVGPLLAEDLGDPFQVERLEVRAVGEAGVGHDRRRVRVDDDRAEAVGAQHLQRLAAGVVRPSTVPSYSETCVASRASLGATAKPWFCEVTSTRPLARSSTGWLAPRWPNGSLKVSRPSACPSSWWPRQMPNTGTRPSRPRTVAVSSSSGPGSPGPFE